MYIAPEIFWFIVGCLTGNLLWVGIIVWYSIKQKGEK